MKKVPLIVTTLIFAANISGWSEGTLGMDPILQKWVEQDKVFSVNPSKNTDISLEAETNLTIMKKPTLSAPAPPRPSDVVKDNNEQPRFTIMDELKVNLKNLELGSRGVNYMGSLPEFQKVYINGVALEIKSYTWFDAKNGRIVGTYLIKEPVAFPTKYGDVILYSWTGFTPEGQLNFICPSYEDRDFVVGDITIPYRIKTPDYSLGKIFFHDNGNLKDIHIAQDLRLDVYGYSILFKHHQGCGGDLAFYKNEKFRRGYLAEDTSIEGITYPQGAYLEFWDNGQLRAVLGSNEVWKRVITIQGVKIGTTEIGGGVIFTKDGKLAGVHGFAEDTELYGINFKKGQSMRYNINDAGKLIPWADDIGPNRSFYIINGDE